MTTPLPPVFTVVVPAYNVAATISETLASILRQTYSDLELIVVDDGSTDRTLSHIEGFLDPRIRVVRQKNRGLAGARNTGIHHARGKFVAFCDADDIWEAMKLELHERHLESNRDIGVSYAGSSMIDANGRKLRFSQRPKLRNITAADIFKRNPIGNGSVAVFRREALECIRHRPHHETERDWWFDESLRQSEDIDAWLRVALSSDWTIEGIPGLLTRYRILSVGLSANIEKQYETWNSVKEKVCDLSPTLYAKCGKAAEAYQLRFLARRSFALCDGPTAAQYARRSLRLSRVPLFEEPAKTLTTLFACEGLMLFSGRLKFVTKFLTGLLR
jgi:glycosyltransferase involved in cell wall biosynthesis